MKMHHLLLFSMLLFLTGCAEHMLARPDPPQNLKALLAPTVIEDRYPTVDELMADPKSLNGAILDHATAGDVALAMCNADKVTTLALVIGDTKPKPKKGFWSLGHLFRKESDPDP